MQRHVARSLAVSVVLCCLSTVAHAGPYADDMAKCLVKSASEADRLALIKWIYAGLSLHPEVEPMAKISEEQRTQINKATGELFQRLLTEACLAETKQAIKYVGPAVMQYAFQILGQSSMAELVTAPKVRQGMNGFTKYLDEKKVRSAIGLETEKTEKDK